MILDALKVPSSAKFDFSARFTRFSSQGTSRGKHTTMGGAEIL